MECCEQAIPEKIEMALESIRKERGEGLASAIAPILEINRDRGRIRRFLDSGTVASVHEYVVRVAACYAELQFYIQNLQVKRDEDEWRALLQTMTRLANGYLCRKGMPASPATWEKAEICAQEVAQRVLTAHFPFDTAFMPWLSVIIRYTGAAAFEEESKTMDRNITELDEPVEDAGAETGRQIEHRLGLNREVLDVLDKLAPARRAVIVLYYLEGKSFEEIARELDKSVNAIHQLHFHALGALRKHLNNSSTEKVKNRVSRRGNAPP